MKWCLVVLILVGFARAENSVESAYSIFNCPELNSQEEIDLDKIMGKWYVVEVLKHKIDLLKPLGGSYVVDSCPIVQLKPFEYSSLKLLWAEKAGNIEYTFRIPDISRKPGFWLSTSLQNGNFTLEYQVVSTGNPVTVPILTFSRISRTSTADFTAGSVNSLYADEHCELHLPNLWQDVRQFAGTMVEREYSQFTGSVHVMKAVASDMVLTFCSRSPDDQLYSILLGREHILQKSDKQGVHNLLGRRGLKISIIQETCINGTVWRRESFDIVVLTALIGLLSSSILFRPWQ